MKNIAPFLLLFPVLLFSQSYEIKYRTFISGIHGDLQEIAKHVNDKKNDDNKFEKTLIYNNGISLYGSSLDDFYEVEDTERSNEYVVATNQVEVVTYFKNQKENILIENYTNWMPMIYGDDILVKTELPKHSWKITDQKNIISGYKCTLAKTTDQYSNEISAWFTDEIGINDGPNTYWGLPGLIIQLQIGERILIAATSVKKLKKGIKILEPTTKGKVMTLSEFKDFKKEMQKPRTITTPDGKVITISGFGNN